MKLRSEYFFCYSYDLAKYIINEGISYITIAKNSNTDKLFTLFERTEDVTKAINKFMEKTSIK